MSKKLYIILLLLGVIFVGCSSDSYQIEQEIDYIHEDENSLEKEDSGEVESKILPDLFINQESLPNSWFVELEDDLFNQILPEGNPGFPILEYSEDLIVMMDSEYLVMGVYSSYNENKNGYITIHYVEDYSSQKEEIFNKLNEKSQFGDLKNVFNIENYIIFIQGPNQFIEDMSKLYISNYKVTDVVIEVEY